MTKIFFLLVFLSLSFSNAIGQTRPIRHFTDKDGLPSNDIKDIHKDCRGTLWIATNAGLCTYDGTSFKMFDFKGYNKSNKIWSIEEDEYGNMYFGSFGNEGLIKYDGKDFKSFICNSSVGSNHIRNLQYSKPNKCLYIGTEDGLSILRDTVLTHFTLLSRQGKRRERAMCFFEKDDTTFVHTFTGGTHYYLHSTDSIYKLAQEHPYYQYSSSQTSINSKEELIQGVFRNGLKIFKPDSTFQYTDIGQVFDIKEDKHGDTWLAAWSYYDMEEPGGFFRIRNDSLEWLNPKLGIDYKMGWSICYDKEQDIYWLGTNGNGLYLYKDNGITTYPASYFGLDDLKCYDLKEVEDNILITAGNNLIIGNEKKGFKTYTEKDLINNSKQYKLISGVDKKFSKRIQASQLTPNDITKLYSIEEHKNEVWIGSVRGYYVLKEGVDSFLYRPSHRLLCENFKFINDTTIFGAGYGAHRKISNYKYDTAFEDVGDDNKPKDINRIVEMNGELWFSSWNRGLYHFRDGQYFNYSIDSPEMALNYTDLCKDNYGHLIAGTNDGQVHVIRYNNDTISIIHKIKDEIKGNSVRWLLADSNNNLWVGTNLGLNILSLDSLHLKGRIDNRFFDDVEGFEERDIRTAIESHNGSVFFGGKEALIKIEPDKFLSHNSKSKVELTNILVNNESVDWSTNVTWNNLPKVNFELPHDENSLIFEFNTNNEYNAGKDLFAVKLNGFDKQFSGWQASNRATYTNLDAGKYTLVVKCKNISTGQMSTSLVLPFKILRPWWKAWWFFVAVVVTISLSTWYFITRRIKRIKKNEQEKRNIDEQISNLKTQAIQAQMNPHFVFNAITSVQSFMLSNDNEAALDYLTLFATLIRKTFDLVSEKQITLQTELDYLENYIQIESMRFIGGISYKINTEDDIDAEEILIPPLLLQPFVENATKHGLAPSKRERQLNIYVKSVNGVIQVSIQDNGIGLAQSLAYKKINRANHNSKGILMAKERIKQMDGYNEFCGVHIDNLDNDKGTVVLVDLPFSKG